MQQGRLFDTPAIAKTSDEYYTPKFVFDALGVHFDLDVASPEGGTHVPCTRYYTIHDNGLTQPWHGNVWMNPPFSQGTPWFERFLNHRNGICLSVFSKSKWFERLWNEADAITIPPIHMKFEQGGIFLPVFIAGIGQHNADAINRTKWNKVR